MNRENGAGDRRDEAVAWFLQLQECDDETMWIAHRDWLEADPANVEEYFAVEQVWLDAEHLQVPRAISGNAFDLDMASGPQAQSNVVDFAERRAVVTRRRAFIWIPSAAAAALVAVLMVPQIGDVFGSSEQTYQTDSSAGREIILADGSRLTLDRNTKAVVRMDRQRSIVLDSGQAAFDVRHDAQRPFTIAAAGREVRVLGTEFDVLARDGAFGVSVRRGRVSVSDMGSPKSTVTLPAGKALLRLPGGTRDEISNIDPDNALAWRDGRLVYLDSDLVAVARDYERYIGKPVVVAPEVAYLHISGVVKARDEDDLVGQLEQLLPVRIVKTTTGREIRKK